VPPEFFLAALFLSLGIFLMVSGLRGAKWLTTREDADSPWLTMSAPELWTRSLGAKGARWYAALVGLFIAGLALIGILGALGRP
jgi:hypothetical protein